jgi:hypothetical protein
MGHHLEYIVNDHRHRSGEYPDLLSAMQAASIADGSAAFVYEAPGSLSIGAGHLVAIRAADGEWFDELDTMEQPKWWEKVTPSVQAQLLAHPDEPLGDSMPAVVAALGTAVGIWFPNLQDGPDGFYLTDTESDWLKVEAARRSIEAAP